MMMFKMMVMMVVVASSMSSGHDWCILSSKLIDKVKDSNIG